MNKGEHMPHSGIIQTGATIALFAYMAVTFILIIIGTIKTHKLFSKPHPMDAEFSEFYMDLRISSPCEYSREEAEALYAVWQKREMVKP